MRIRDCIDLTYASIPPPFLKHILEYSLVITDSLPANNRTLKFLNYHTTLYSSILRHHLRKKNVKMKKSLFIILLVSCIMSCSEKSFHYTSSPSGIEFILNGVKKRLTFYNQSIVRVSVAKENDSFTDSRLVVVLSPPNVHFTVEESDDLTLKTDSLTLKIN